MYFDQNSMKYWQIDLQVARISGYMYTSNRVKLVDLQTEERACLDYFNCQLTYNNITIV